MALPVNFYAAASYSDAWDPVNLSYSQIVTQIFL